MPLIDTGLNNDRKTDARMIMLPFFILSVLSKRYNLLSTRKRQIEFWASH